MRLYLSSTSTAICKQVGQTDSFKTSPLYCTMKILSITKHTDSNAREQAPHAAMNESVRSQIVQET
jgi:hypothetical protein